jgi:signal transduction histidine kinase
MSELTITKERLSDTEYLQLTTSLMNLFVIVFVKAERALKYNVAQLETVMGHSPMSQDVNLDQLMHPDDAEIFDKLTEELSAGTAITPATIRFMHGNGVYLSYHVTALPSHTGDIILTFISQTSLIGKGRESNISQANHTIDRLQQSNRELEDFAYVASHDLQEPLRKISTFGGRLYERYSSQLDQEGQMYLNRMLTASVNMRMFIDNLLEFSRIDRVAHTVAPTDLGFILKQVIADLELKIEETGTQVTFDKLPMIDAVSSQMKQLFNNVISNSIKFRRPDVPPVINISAHEVSDYERIQYGLPENNVYYKIAICDNGIGIESGYEERIFEVFQRLHGKSEYPGSGIGLAICKKIVAYHKGLLFAGNNQDNGACIIAILPQKHP